MVDPLGFPYGMACKTCGMEPQVLGEHLLERADVREPHPPGALQMEQ